MQKAAENAAAHLPMAAPFFAMHFATRPGIPFCKRTRKLDFVLRIVLTRSRVHSRNCRFVACLPLPLPPTPLDQRFECQTLCLSRRLESAQTVSIGQRSALSAGGARFCPPSRCQKVTPFARIATRTKLAFKDLSPSCCTSSPKPCRRPTDAWRSTSTLEPTARFFSLIYYSQHLCTCNVPQQSKATSAKKVQKMTRT